MQKHTICRICKKAHPLGGCPEFKKKPPDLMEIMKKGLKKPRNIKAVLTDAEKEGLERIKPKYDRNEAHRNYMREYQRRKRAEKETK